MANITTFYSAKKDCRINDDDLFAITKKFTAPATGILNGDFIQLQEIPCGLRLMQVDLVQAATLGAGATLTAVINRSGARTTLTATTTAAAASKVTGAAIVNLPFETQVGDILELQVGGANITAAAAVSLDVLAQRL